MSFVHRLVCLSALLAPIAGLGCAGTDDPSPTGGAGSGESGADLSAFADFCTGTLTVDKGLMVPWRVGAWQTSDTLVAPAGSQFILEFEFSKWEGYVIQPDGSANQIESEWETGLVLGTDFISDCNLANRTTHFALVQDSTFYANEELTGEPCVVPAGTWFQYFSFLGKEDVASFSADDLEALCGYRDGYSADIAFGKLVVRQ